MRFIHRAQQVVLRTGNSCAMRGNSTSALISSLAGDACASIVARSTARQNWQAPDATDHYPAEQN
jgi:hypothetical protein